MLFRSVDQRCPSISRLTLVLADLDETDPGLLKTKPAVAALGRQPFWLQPLTASWADRPVGLTPPHWLHGQVDTTLDERESASRRCGLARHCGWNTRYSEVEMLCGSNGEHRLDRSRSAQLVTANMLSFSRFAALDCLS